MNLKALSFFIAPATGKYHYVKIGIICIYFLFLQQQSLNLDKLIGRFIFKRKK